MVFAITMTYAGVPREGGSPTDTRCGVLAAENGESWIGACGGEPPSDTQPCQVTVVFTSDAEGPLVTGEILCANMQQFSSPTPQRELSGPGDGATAAMTPLRFAFHNCQGLTAD